MFAGFIGERARPTEAGERLDLALRQLPGALHRSLVGVGLFGAGDVAHPVLIQAATRSMTPTWARLKAAGIGASLYVLHRVVDAAAAHPAEGLADKHGHHRVLAACFALAGLINGIQDRLEGATTGMLAPADRRGLAFGRLGATHRVGDLVSSLVVALLWTACPAIGFGYAATLMAAGAIVTHLPHRDGREAYRRPRRGPGATACASTRPAAGPRSPAAGGVG